MLRRLSVLAMSAVVAIALVGCSVQRPPEMPTPPQPGATEPGAKPLAVSPIPKQQGSDATHWDLPAQGLREFLGEKLVAYGGGSGTLSALDRSGAPLWSLALKDDAVDLIVRSDGAQALTLSSSGSIQVDLARGAIVGAGPLTQPAAGLYIWHGDWLLSGVMMYKAPVDPKSPGKSEDHMEWNLYHFKGQAWEQIDLMGERGGFGGSLSADGSVALIKSKGEPSAVLFVEGHQTQAIKAKEAHALFLLTASGTSVLVLDGEDLVVFTAEGKETARKPVGAGKQLTVWGDRAVVADSSSFSVYDPTGRELFHQTGTVSQQRPNDKYLLVGAGGKTTLVDDTGKPVASYANDLESMGMSPDGKWIYVVTDTGLDAYAVPR